MGLFNFEMNDNTHKAFKIKCISRNITMEDQTNKLIEAWVEGKEGLGEFSELDEGEE